MTVFWNRLLGAVGGRQRKIDQLISIVGETDEVAGRRNPFLNSRVRIFDDLGDGA
jgi:hypothetical protein